MSQPRLFVRDVTDESSAGVVSEVTALVLDGENLATWARVKYTVDFSEHDKSKLNPRRTLHIDPAVLDQMVQEAFFAGRKYNAGQVRRAIEQITQGFPL